MTNKLKIKLHEATQNNDGGDSYRFAKIIYTFKNPYGVKETFSEIIHFRDRIPVDSIKDKVIESFYEGMRVNGFIPVGKEDEHVVVLEAANGKFCKAEYSDKDRPFKIDYTKYAKPGALRKFVTVVDVIWSNDMYDEFWQGNEYLIDQARKRDKERDERGEYSEAVSKVLSEATIRCSMQKNEKSYLLDADDRNILNRNFYSDVDMDLLERNFGMLKFVDSFFPDDKTNGTATQTEISAEDAETMVGDHESFLVLCMDTLSNKDGFDYQVYRVYGPKGTDYITCSYK